MSTNQTSLDQDVQIAEERMKEASQQRSIAIDAHNSATKSVSATDKEIQTYKDKIDGARGQISKLEGELVAITQRLKDIALDSVNRSKDEAQILQRLTCITQ